MMAYHDLHQQFPFQNPQAAWMNPQAAQTYGFGLGQAAYGQQFGPQGGQQFGQPNIGAWGLGGGWGQGQHRQLSQNDVGDVVRQLVPLLPQLLAQAQQQPQAAFGYGGFGQGYGQNPRTLTQQDVNEVVRQILPILPQIVGTLQGQGPQYAAAMYGGQGPQFGLQNPLSQFSNPFQQQPFGQQGQQGWPNAMSAFGGSQAWGQRQLNQQDVSEVVRQLVGIIPQVIGNLQAYGQQRMN
jgi:hypothetical protein